MKCNYYYKFQIILKEPLVLCEGETFISVDIQPKIQRLLSANEKFQNTSIKLSKLANSINIFTTHLLKKNGAIGKYYKFVRKKWRD